VTVDGRADWVLYALCLHMGQLTDEKHKSLSKKILRGRTIGTVMKSRVGERKIVGVLLDREVGFGNWCGHGNGRLKEFDNGQVPRHR
jgi:hypothetical protein